MQRERIPKAVWLVRPDVRPVDLEFQPGPFLQMMNATVECQQKLKGMIIRHLFISCDDRILWQRRAGNVYFGRGDPTPSRIVGLHDLRSRRPRKIAIMAYDKRSIRQASGVDRAPYDQSPHRHSLFEPRPGGSRSD